jgi:arginine decarboxylase-like protein
VSQFRKKNTDLILLEISGILINKLRDIAEAFSKHFQSVYGSSCSVTFPFINQSTKVLPLAPISNSDVHNAIKRLRPTKSVGLDGIPSFIIKGCSNIFVPVFKFMFNLSLFQNVFPNLWKQAAIIPVLKKKKPPLLKIIGP